MPYSLPKSAIPFNLNIPDGEYSDLQHLLRLARVGPLTWENKHADGRYGVPYHWLASIKDYWLTKFDWRAQERRINSFSNYKLRVEDHTGTVDLHFVALLSAKENAIPLVLLHGWPGSFVEFLPMLKLLRGKYDAESLPFHVIVPSLPGYVFSSGPPQDTKWLAEDAARIINHVNLLPYLDQVDVNDPDLTAWEKEVVEKSKARFAAPKSGAAIMNSTRPATIWAVLSSSPLAYLAWIGEKFHEWPEEPSNADHILTNVTLYWVTDTLPRSIYTYRHTFLCGDAPSFPYFNKPFGYSWFRYELAQAPKQIVEKKGQLVFYRQYEHGGHFAALERPQEFLTDMEDFFQIVSSKLGA